MIIGLEHYKHTYNVASETVIRPGLDNMKQAMELLQEPQTAYRVVHVAGTNGKGSTVTYMKELTQRHGLKVGTFMSPGIIDVHDQIQVNGVPISQQELAHVFTQMHEAGLSGLCTDFELLTCAAFVHFRNAGVDVAIIEAGLGGRFDSTNVVEPTVSVITSIALEHTNFLGDSIEQIAFHKAGIIKPGAVAVIGQMTDTVHEIFATEANAVGAKLERIGEHFSIVDHLYVDDKLRIEGIQPGMQGQHQFHNAALAIRAMQHIVPLQIQIVLEAIAAASLPFRFEKITDSLYFDGAHNPASVKVLVETIKQEWQEPIQFVVGMLADKDVVQVLSLLEEVSDDFVFVNFDNSRAIEAQKLLEFSTAKYKRIEQNPAAYLVQRAKSGQKTMVTGSLYLLASLRVSVLLQLEN